MLFELLEVLVFFSITKAQEQIIIKKKFTVIPWWFSLAWPQASRGTKWTELEEKD